LIDINDDGIVLADRSNQYGVGNIPVAYRDIQSIKLGAIKTYTAEPVPLGKSGPPIFKNPLVGKAVHAGVVE
jgi:hypothetical protein